MVDDDPGAGRKNEEISRKPLRKRRLDDCFEGAMVEDALSEFRTRFPLLSDTRLQRRVRLNDFGALYDCLHLLGHAETNAYLGHCLVEFARLDRASYIKANDMIDRVLRERPEFGAFFQKLLERRIARKLHVPTIIDDAWARSTRTEDHHLFDLWAELIRRKLRAKVSYTTTVWQPTIMCIEITQQCNAVCGHCASNSSPTTKIRLGPEKVHEIVVEAAREGVAFLGLTGGEPFLEQPTLLEAIRTATENGVRFDYINSNCFWAKTEERAVAMLERIKAVADETHLKQLRGMFSLSVTTEHLKWVPIENFVNVIRAHEKVFPGQTLEMVSVRGKLFGEDQEAVFHRIIELLGEDFVRLERDDEGKISRIFTRKSEIDVFFNYIVPIGRGEDMKYDEYEHYRLTDKELNKGLSALHVDNKVVQTITVGWDGKCAPDVVLKCSESVIAGNLHLQSFAEVIQSGNNDPLIRGILDSVYRLLNISKQTGFYELMETKLRFHNSIQGYVSEFMKDPKKRLLMTIDLLREDIQAGETVMSDGKRIEDIDAFIADVIGDGEDLLPALHHLCRTFLYDFNFSGTTIKPNALVVLNEGSHSAVC